MAAYILMFICVVFLGLLKHHCTGRSRWMCRRWWDTTDCRAVLNLNDQFVVWQHCACGLNCAVTALACS